MITMNSNLCQTQTNAHTLLRNVLNHRCQRECFGCFFLTKKGRTTSVWKNKSHHKCWGEYMASVNCSNRCLVIALCALLADNCRFRAESAEITCNFSFPKRSDIVWFLPTVNVRLENMTDLSVRQKWNGNEWCTHSSCPSHSYPHSHTWFLSFFYTGKIFGE